MKFPYKNSFINKIHFGFLNQRLTFMALGILLENPVTAGGDVNSAVAIFF